jgi:hypothetical protein
VIVLVFFRHAQNFDASSGVRLLKDFFKKLAQTCQQHGQDTFIHQVSCHLQTLMTLRKARNASQGFSNLVEQRRKEELLVVVPEHCLNGGHLYSIVHDHTQRAVHLRCTAATREHKSTRPCSLGLGRTGKRSCPLTTAA